MTAPTRRPPAPTDETGALSFEPAPRDKQANITIEVGPMGITIRAEYTGPLSSIPRSIERLREEGILELVRTHAAQPAASGAKRAAQPRVQPAYNGDGVPLCPRHKKPLKEGQWGLYCPAKDESTERGYCALKFEE